MPRNSFFKHYLPGKRIGFLQSFTRHGFKITLPSPVLSDVLRRPTPGQICMHASATERTRPGHVRPNKCKTREAMNVQLQPLWFVIQSWLLWLLRRNASRDLSSKLRSVQRLSFVWNAHAVSDPLKIMTLEPDVRCLWL